MGLSGIDKSRDGFIQKLNGEYGKVAGKLGLFVKSQELENLKRFSRGSFDQVTHVLNYPDADDIVIQTVILSFQAHGLMGSAMSEATKHYCGLIVPRPVHASIYLKDVRDGFRSRLAWVPYDKNVRAGDAYKRKANWSPLLDQLNNDGELGKLFKQFKTEKNIHGIDRNLEAYKRAMYEVKVFDKEDNHNTTCQIVPMGDRTLVAVEQVVGNPKHLEQALRAIMRLHQIISSNGAGAPATGPMVQSWGSDLAKVLNASAPEMKPAQQTVSPSLSLPPSSVVVTPQASPGDTVSCPKCGTPNPAGNAFCGGCGVRLEKLKACPSCGAEVTPGFRFCGKCGAMVDGAADVPSAPKPQPVQAEDPLMRMINETTGGRRAKWTVRFMTSEGKEYEMPLWNYASEDWLTSEFTLMKAAEKIRQHPHYSMHKAIKYVKSPSGNAAKGGWMNLTVRFSDSAPPRMARQVFQLLMIGEGEEAARLIACNEQNLERGDFDEIIGSLARSPHIVEQFTLWGPTE